MSARVRGYTATGEPMLSQLLINEPPLQVLPTLAVLVGLNEAIVLQQLHYWLAKSANVQDGRKWVYNSYEQWQAQFPFWHVNTIQRTFGSLEKQGVVLSDRLEAGLESTQVVHD